MKLKKNSIIYIILGAIIVLSTLGVWITFSNSSTSNNIPNSEYALELMSAYGDTEACHPKVIAFDKEWNGYTYWMAFTPYPKADESKENPHILASNDMINWEEPLGYKNPLEPNMEYTDEKGKKKYNSDTNLVYRKDINRLECYWRFVNEEQGKVIIYKKYTTDGVTWSESEKVIELNKKESDCISPAIIFDDNMYKMWYVDNGYIVKYRESYDGFSWTEPRVLNISYDINSLANKDMKNWHIDIIKTEKGYEMLMSAFEKGTSRTKMDLYYSKSKDNIDWEPCSIILRHSDNVDNWDNKGIYKSTFIYKNGIYYVFYSGINEDETRGVGLSFGKDINNLKGLTYDNENELFNLINK